MKVTIKDIAERAGVHRSTVDKVIHEREGVSDEVRSRIQKIIKEMNYKPNPAGRLLQKQGRIYNITAIMVEVDAFPFLQQGIIEGVTAQTGFDIHITWKTGKFSDPLLQAKYVEETIDEAPDAIIITPINSESVYIALQKAIESNIMVVQMNSFLPSLKGSCFVSMDSKRASMIAAHLMGEFLRGTGEVAIISSAIASENNNSDVHIRETGFTDYINKLYPDIKIVECVESFEDLEITRKKTIKLLEKYPNLKGIYITCGGAYVVGQILKESGRWNNIKTFSFEDYPEILKLIKDGVIDCSISGNTIRQGSWPIELIMDYLVFDKKPESDSYYTETKIILKESIF